MMISKRRAIALAIPFALLAAACGDDVVDDQVESAVESAADEAKSAAEEAASEVESAIEEAAPEVESAIEEVVSEVDSAVEEIADEAVCPANLVIQSDWWPEVEHGGTFQLIGTGGTSNPELFTYSGPIQEQYKVGGIETVEFRAGGDAIEFQPVVSVMKTDQDITLGYVNTDDAISSSPTVQVTAVATTLEVNPQMIMWDPTQTDIDKADPTTFAKSGKRVLHFGGTTYIDWMIAKGYLTADQSDPNYGGAPTDWITEGGSFIQQGFATNEIFKYENEIPWKDGAPADVEFALIHELGWQPYPAMYTVLTDRLEELSPCLTVLVPVLQQAWVDFFADPTPVADKIIEVAASYNNYWSVSTEINEAAFPIMDELGISSNGPDDTYGNIDPARVDALFAELVPIMEAAGLELPAGYTAESAYTNEFIDPSIGR